MVHFGWRDARKAAKRGCKLIARASAFAAAVTLTLATAAPAEAQIALGPAPDPAELHQQMLEQFGGEYEEGPVDEYVERLGSRLAALSSAPNAQWTFTVLDTPVLNAFALPGGYVYITRGMLALAADEAELAGILGHEIGHVTAGHIAAQQGRAARTGLGLTLGTIVGDLLGGDELARTVMELGGTAAAGYLAGHSREAEFEADLLGVQILQRAGYDPQAQADFLGRMARAHALEAELSGGSYSPDRVDFFATHPATADRVQQAIAEARRLGSASANLRNEDTFLDVIDGMIWGDSPEQGFVRGRAFLHPGLRFAFLVPEGYRITNAAARVLAQGPDGARLVMDAVDDPGGDPLAYLRDGWAQAIAAEAETGPLTHQRELEINGLEAATGLMRIEREGGRIYARLAVIRHGDRLYRFFGSRQAGDEEQGRNLLAAIETFRPLSETEADLLAPLRIRVSEVGPRDTVAGLAGAMPVDRAPVRRLRLLNDLGEQEELQAGERVKLIAY